MAFGLCFLAFSGCKSPDPENLVAPAGKTIAERINAPRGYERVSLKAGSFGHFLRHQPLKEHGAKVHYYDGEEKRRQKTSVAVLDIDVGERDLQQCADAVMRLRAEYLFKHKRFEDIHFKFTNGERVDYLKYANGYRATVKNDKVTWKKSAKKDRSYTTFRKYLNLIFTFSGSHSLERELDPVKSTADIQVGDVIVKGGFPGHVLIVVDAATNEETGDRLFLLAQGSTPAQEMHIVTNPEEINRSPWYHLTPGKDLDTAEYFFKKVKIKRFRT